MYGTYSRLGLSVHASPREVIRAARGKLKPAFLGDRSKREERRAFYSNMVAWHGNAWQTWRFMATGAKAASPICPALVKRWRLNRDRFTRAGRADLAASYARTLEIVRGRV